MNVLRKRPAETTSLVGGAVAALLARPLGLKNPDEVAALAIVLGSIPAAVTWLVVTIERARSARA